MGGHHPLLTTALPPHSPPPPHSHFPEDHPADFYYFFESGTRKRCYIAPERFVRERDLAGATAGDSASSPDAVVSMSLSELLPATGPNGATVVPPTLPPMPSGGVGSPPAPARALTPAMDIFSLGCVVGEVLTDGLPLFDLPTLLRYRSSGGGGLDGHNVHPEGVVDALREGDPSGALTAMIKHMVARDPGVRGSAEAYLSFNTEKPRGVGVSSVDLHPPNGVEDAPGGPPVFRPPNALSSKKPRIFPAYFPLLFRFFAGLLTPELSSPDARVLAVAAAYPSLLESIGGVADPAGVALLAHRLSLEDAADVSRACRGLSPAVTAAVAERLAAEGDPLHAAAAHSVGGRAAAELALELGWEWGWTPGTEWGAGDGAPSGMADLYSPWRPQQPAEVRPPCAAPPLSPPVPRTLHRTPPVTRSSTWRDCLPRRTSCWRR